MDSSLLEEEQMIGRCTSCGRIGKILGAALIAAMFIPAANPSALADGFRGGHFAGRPFFPGPFFHGPFVRGRVFFHHRFFFGHPPFFTRPVFFRPPVVFAWRRVVVVPPPFVVYP
jgi:hypothetical protein